MAVPGRGVLICAPQAVAPQVDILQPDKRIPWSGHMARHALQALYEAIVDARMSIVFVNTRAQADLYFRIYGVMQPPDRRSSRLVGT